MSFFLLMFAQWGHGYAYLFTFGWRHHPLDADQTSRFRGSKFYWNLVYNTILLGGNLTLIREIPTYLLGAIVCFAFFGNNHFGTRNARKSIKGTKDSYYSLESIKTLNHETGSLYHWWCHQTNAKLTPIMTSLSKALIPKPNFFFIRNYKTFLISRRLEQLSSFICCWVMTDQILPWEVKSYQLQNFHFCQKLGFWAIILAPDVLKGQSRALKLRITT